MRDVPFCSDASLDREEPQFGTASTVRRWILVERNGPWGAQALWRNRFGEKASQRLRALGQAMGARVLLIRKHGRYEQHGIRAFAAFTGRGSRWLQRLNFADIDALLAHDFDPLRQGCSVGGAWVREPRYFVCTHGKHDPCCGRKGLSVARMLHKAMPEAAWETSHIGGDRFAGNLLALPLGIYYGRVEPAQAVRLVGQLGKGRLDLAYYRGRSYYPFAAQAAEWLARERLTLLAFDDLHLEAHEGEGTSTRTTFRLAKGERIQVEVQKTMATPARLTCHAERDVDAPTYRLTDLLTLD